MVHAHEQEATMVTAGLMHLAWVCTRLHGQSVEICPEHSFYAKWSSPALLKVLKVMGNQSMACSCSILICQVANSEAHFLISSMSFGAHLGDHEAGRQFAYHFTDPDSLK